MGLGLPELVPYLVIVGQLFILFKVFPFTAQMFNALLHLFIQMI